MSKRFTWLSVLLIPSLLLIPCLASSAAARQEGMVHLRGLAEDPVGGALKGVIVTATHLETDRKTATRTDPSGRFLLELPAGRYRVEATTEYFEPAARELDLEADRTLDFRLEISVFTSSVNVIERSRGELLMVPGGIAEVGVEDIERASYGNVEEALAFQPGVLARSRFGADEVQFSVRGSGLRNNFHMRGIHDSSPWWLIAVTRLRPLPLIDEKRAGSKG